MKETDNPIGFRLTKENKARLKEIEEYTPTVSNRNATMNHIIESWHTVVIPERIRFKKETVAKAKSLGMSVYFSSV